MRQLPRRLAFPPGQDHALFRFAQVLLLVLPFLFFLVGLLRALPFYDDVGPPRGDDWEIYKANAISVLQNGLQMPLVAGRQVGGVYYAPAGFLYNYFLAACFAIFGVNSAYIYVIQSFTLGLSISLMGYLALKRLGPLLGVLYTVVLAVFMFGDMFRGMYYYAFRLLSENLLIVLIPALLLTFLRAFESGVTSWSAVSGSLAGLCILTRPNVFPAIVALTIAGGIFAVRNRRGAWTLPVVFLLVAIAVAMLLPFRNYVVTGQATVPALQTGDDWVTPQSTAPGYLALFYAKRVLFTVGFTGILGDPFRSRVHWLVMWLCFVLYIALMIWQRRKPEFWETIAMTFTGFYLGPLVAVALINNYGYRMLVPIVPVVLILSFRSFPLLGSALKLQQPHGRVAASRQPRSGVA